MLTKLFSAEQIRHIDAETIRRQGIKSHELMERAGFALFKAMLPYWQPDRRVVVLAGPGNNGGDGLVIARLLHERDYPVAVRIVRFTNKMSPDFALNLSRLEATGVEVRDFDGRLPEADLYVDALFGTGLNRPAAGIATQAIEALNGSDKPVLSIDIPSGLYADRLNGPDDPVVKPARVYTVQFPKISFFYAENAVFVPVFQTVDIGLDAHVMAQTASDVYMISGWRDWMPARAANAAKWDFGHAVLVGGSRGKVGSIRFAAKAALRIGAGWVTAHVPADLVNILQTADPEIMVTAGKTPGFLTDFPVPEGRNAYGIGPGLGTDGQTAAALASFLEKADRPVVIDADGLNILAQNPEMLELLPAGSILTPHAGEWERLAGPWEHTPEKWEQAREFAGKYGIVLVLKGRYTVVTDGREIRINPSGNAALAKAGSGDVLTGMITGLLAQGVAPLDAASAAVYMHGQIADEWVRGQNDFALTPQDLIKGLAFVGKSLLCNVRV